MFGTNKGHNDRFLQPKCRFSLATIFVLGKEKGELARVAQEIQDHINSQGFCENPLQSHLYH
jgi:hypothetical protein